MLKKVNQAAEAEALEPYINAYAQDANAMDDLIVQTTLRELLSYQVFAGSERRPRNWCSIRSARNSLAGVEAMLKRLNGGRSPSDAEINAALDTSSRVRVQPQPMPSASS